MADVRLSIASREYIVTCKDGEENRLQALGRIVDEKAREAAGAGGLNESRQLLFAGLLLADQLHDAVPTAATGLSEPGAEAIEHYALSIERLAERLEKLVQGLEESR
jgi:cell division protein ZapA